MKNITFRISFQDFAALKDFAESKNMTVSEAMRELIRSIGKQKAFEARLIEFMKKIESELGTGGSDNEAVRRLIDEMININKGLSILLNRHGRNEWEDMNKLKKALYLLAGSNPHAAKEIKAVFEN